MGWCCASFVMHKNPLLKKYLVNLYQIWYEASIGEGGKKL